MFEVSDSAILEGTPERVFPIAADPERQLEWDPKTLKSVEKLTPGSLAKNSRYRGEFKGFGVVEYEFAEYDPPHQFAHRTAMNMGDMVHRFEFEPTPQGTQLRQILQVQPRGIWKLMAPMMKRMIRKRLHQIGVEIEHYLKTH